jgi:hypothetical protein
MNGLAVGGAAEIFRSRETVTKTSGGPRTYAVAEALTRAI